MKVTPQQIIESLAQREPTQFGGIGTAKPYLKEIANCLSGGGLCPANIFGMVDSSRWEKALEEAESRLTYSLGGVDELGILTKSLNDGTSIGSGIVLEYDAILATRDRDRDKDIVRPKGMNIDVRMPLLWQHIQLQPIGKHVSVIDQTDLVTKCRFAIADTELGRDAAVLVKMGALRKSHGFIPEDAEPVETYKGLDGKEYARGWDVKSCNVVEGSLVSIPSNPHTGVTAIYAKGYGKEFDGICTAFGRDLLKAPLVKHWAKSIYDSRPVAVRGVDLSDGRLSQPVTIKRDGWEISGAGELTIETKGERIAVSTQNLQVNTKGGAAAGKDQTQLTPGDSVSGSSQGKSCGREGCDGKLDSTGTCAKCGYVGGDAKKSLSEDTLSGPAGQPGGSGGSASSTGTTTKACGCGDGGRQTKENTSPAGPAAETLSDELMTKMYGMRDHYLEGSFEWTRDRLHDTAYKHLAAHGVDVESRWSVDIVATFAGEAILCASDYSKSPTERKCYRLTYASGDDGPKWSGEPKEVEIKAVVLEKALLTLGNLTTKSAKLAGRKVVEDDSELSLQELARRVAQKAIFSDGPDVAECLRELKGAIALIQDQQEAAEMEALLAGL